MSCPVFFDLPVCWLAGTNRSSDRFNLSVDVCLDVDLFAVPAAFDIEELQGTTRVLCHSAEESACLTLT